MRPQQHKCHKKARRRRSQIPLPHSLEQEQSDTILTPLLQSLVLDDCAEPKPRRAQDVIELNNTIRAENERMKNARLCKQCCVNGADMLLLPCSHITLCENCRYGYCNRQGESIPECTKCPHCSETIQGTVKVFYT